MGVKTEVNAPEMSVIIPQCTGKVFGSATASVVDQVEPISQSVNSVCDGCLQQLVWVILLLFALIFSPK